MRPASNQSHVGGMVRWTEKLNHWFKPTFLRNISTTKYYKKDGYRQQNVRQPQKLISIIDYDVCILEYLQPFWRYSASKNCLTLKSGYGVLQGHLKMRDSIDHVWLSISPPL